MHKNVRLCEGDTIMEKLVEVSRERSCLIKCDAQVFILITLLRTRLSISN